MAEQSRVRKETACTESQAVLFFVVKMVRQAELAVWILHSKSLLNICFEDAENGFMALYRHLQCGQQSLGSEEIHNDPLLNKNWILRNPNGLWVESEVHNKLFGRTGHSTEVRITSNCILVLDLDLDRLLLLRALRLCRFR